MKTTRDKNRFQVKQWNCLEIDLDRKFNFIKTFNQVCLFISQRFVHSEILLFKLSDNLSSIPLNDANVLLVEQPTYRFPNLKLATYVSQLQQIRAVFNTLLHSHSLSKHPVYHISGRDMALHFGLFVGNEQSSAEFFLTNLIFNNTGSKQNVSLDIDHELKTNFHRTNKGQREPMARCLLRAVAFLQCVNEKKDFSGNEE